MGLRLHDTATRQVRDFVPLVDDVVTMYQCGATVQSSPHVGHIRAGVCFDVLVRWLTTSGYNVVLVRNVTDIDDKILAKSVTEELPWWAVAAKYEREFQTAYRVLGCTPPTGEPRATGHVPQMIELIARLIDAGHAYPANGDVYFDVRSWDAYGSLSRQNIDDLLPAADSADVQGKKDPRDFALWKGVPDDAEHPLPVWSTPWGTGRPGWHLECSAMATTYLGSQFDIHGGGLDLVFPHHENELAQSRAAGDEFARYWLHNAWVTTAGEKMSKSLGNSLIIEQVLQRVRPIDLRWYLVASHYRSNLEFSDDALAESAASFQRIENFVLRAGARTNATDALGDVYDLLPAEFVDAMNDDLGVPAAVAVLHHHVTEGNRLLNSGSDDEALANELRTVRAMLDVLGVDPFASHWESADDQSDAAQTALSALISDQLAARKQARADKDFAKADEIRDSLTAAGIALEDGPDGTRWSLATEQ